MSRLIVYLFCTAFMIIIIDGKIASRDFDDVKGIEFENVLLMLDNNVIDVQQVLDSVVAEKKCAEVGEYCDRNSDCCSNLCLGFMKRCVSGSKNTFLTIINKLSDDKLN